MESDRAAGHVGPGFVCGLVLIAAGISSLLERARVFESISVGQWWPLLLVAIGLSKFRGGPDERRRAWFFLALGAWCQTVALTALTFSDTWPLILMVWGASIIWCGLPEPDRQIACGREGSHAN